MSFFTLLKIFSLVSWPALFMLPYYFSDKEKFKKRFKEIVKK